MTTDTTSTPIRNRRRAACGAVTVISLLLLGLVWLPLQGDSLSAPLRFAGRLHVMLLHLPIGLLVGVAVLELLARLRRFARLEAACGALLWLAVLSAVPTVVAGALLAADGSYPDDLLLLHRWLGAGTAVLSLWLLVLRPRSGAGCGLARSFAYLSLLLVNVAALVGAGHFGAALTHGSTYLTRYAPWLFVEEPVTAEPVATEPRAGAGG